jgi:hypothetical protein
MKLSSFLETWVVAKNAEQGTELTGQASAKRKHFAGAAHRQRSFCAWHAMSQAEFILTK